MARIYAPNKEYDGVSASIEFSKGIGECSDPYLLDWFRKHGYTVEDEKADPVPEKPDETKPEPEVEPEKKTAGRQPRKSK